MSKSIGGVTGVFDPAGATGTRDISRGIAESAAAARAGMAERRQYGQRAVEQVAPYQQVGRTALERYRDVVLGGDMSQFRTSPGYQFRVAEGVKALERGAAARGGLLSGAQQKALTRYGQDVASQEYQNYLAQVGGLMQQGFGAAGMAGQYLTGTGAGIGSQYGQLGQQQLAGYTARGQQKAQLLGQGMQTAGLATGLMG